MRLNRDVKLRQIGSHFMIGKSDTNRINLTDVFTLNGTAACLWRRIGEDDFTPELLAGWLEEEYDVDRDAALRDVMELLDEWTRYGLVTE